MGERLERKEMKENAKGSWMDGMTLYRQSILTNILSSKIKENAKIR